MRTHEHEGASDRPRTLLKLSALITVVTFAAEVAGGLYANSISLLSDAGHVFMDLTALLFSLFAIALAQRPTTDRRTFGLHRLEVFAAFLNGTLVALLAGGIIFESVLRLNAPQPVKVEVMLVIALWGLAANLFVAWRLHSFAKKDVNIRAAFLHVAGDALASLGVVAGGLLIGLTGRTVIDPAVGVGVGLVILWNAARVIKDSVEILLEGVPKDVDLNEVLAAMRGVSGVAAVEDVHIWSICSHICSLSAHVTVAAGAPADHQRLIDEINALVKKRFSIVHSTIQVHHGPGSGRTHAH